MWWSLYTDSNIDLSVNLSTYLPTNQPTYLDIIKWVSKDCTEINKAGQHTSSLSLTVATLQWRTYLLENQSLQPLLNVHKKDFARHAKRFYKWLALHFFYKDTAEIFPKIKEKLRTLPSISFDSKYNKS